MTHWPARSVGPSSVWKQPLQALAIYFDGRIQPVTATIIYTERRKLLRPGSGGLSLSRLAAH
jgi:hypothetical protein